MYVRGNLKTFDSSASIVGSRRCTNYAHTVALHNNGYTIAVLGTGVDKCYPSEHLTLMNKIIETGAVISQFEPGSTNIKANFVKRNELIAMLSDKIVVVEASKDSGTLYTAHSGIKYNKEVYAVPGSIKSKSSEGTNKLISLGIKPYLSIKDIIYNHKTFQIEEKSERFSKEESEVLALINKNGISIDLIKSMINLPDRNLDELLFEMEAKGIVMQVGGLFHAYL